MNDLAAAPCRQASLAAGEPLAGSAASETDLWLALEVSAPWGPKGLDDSGLSPALVAHLNAFMADHPRARVQLIRKPERASRSVSLYLAHSGEQRMQVMRSALAEHDALLSLDLEAFARGELPQSAASVSEPVYLVCVHGKRDRCCAEHGMPVYSALSALSPEHTWQTTHLGGHRFAATMLVLPHGVSYGRVLPSEAGAILAAHARAELYDLERLRGRTTYAPVVQAADCALRLQLGELRLSGLLFDALDSTEAGQRVWFRDAEGIRHVIEIGRRALGAVSASCGAAPKPIDAFVTLLAQR